MLVVFVIAAVNAIFWPTRNTISLASPSLSLGVMGRRIGSIVNGRSSVLANEMMRGRLLS